ncbi:zinc finger protein, RING-type [Teratosphaeria destructans]|uniref:Zinc finger protein, RING-type n=1 Tax=Teratosphaeria destructans TaxID=418781 RepID=A0A9W7W805_9PEZI|nr:zinc finger protein, RING-type [Teratosphaeria destructans]
MFSQRPLFAHQYNDTFLERPREPGPDLKAPTSLFDLHHTTRIIYPEFSLQENHREKFCLYPLEDDARTRHRYEPLPLIDDNAVIAHTDRENDAETSFFFRNRATKTLPRGTTGPQTLHSVFESLLELMDHVPRWVGSTVLTMWTYESPHFEAVTMVRVGIESSFLTQGGPSTNSARVTFDFTANELFTYNRSHTEPRWLHFMQMLLQRSNDRSYRHVRYQLDRQGETIETPSNILTNGFKPGREEDFHRLLASKARHINPATLDPEDRTCMCCTEELGSPAAPDAVGLACNKGAPHVMCSQCLLKWVDEQGVDYASCPKCRAPVFKAEELQELACGVVKGIYEYDSRFTVFENFERSCADLDKELAEFSSAIITIDADLFLRAWDLICEGTWIEVDEQPELETLHPLSCQEWDIARQVLSHQLFSRDGRSGATSDLFKGLVVEFYEALRERLYFTEMRKVISEWDLWQLAGDSTRATCLDLPPGFREVFKRCLDRTLRFVQVRQCRCANGIHAHGFRKYYNPDYCSNMA